MSWKNAHHDRGPPATAQAMVEADEIVIGTYLVVADPGNRAQIRCFKRVATAAPLTQ